MKAINYKKFLKNILSLFLTLLVMSNLMDFIRKPTVPEDINATALYDLQGNPFFYHNWRRTNPLLSIFGEPGVVIAVTPRRQLTRWQKKAILSFPLPYALVLRRMSLIILRNINTNLRLSMIPMVH